ncbi:MAG: alpha/beta hydrolase [Proteobacteria bacterium]|nr:alpha/beta hydrolase [Pseudomonadota bacterium]
MPLILVDAQAQRAQLHAQGGNTPLAAAFARRDPSGRGPVIILLHGRKYRPGTTDACPHRHLFTTSAEAPWAWSRHLGFGTGHKGEGLGIGFGWNARQSPARALASARAAGLALADTVAAIRAVWPDRPVHMLAHSMGSEVALTALPHLRAGDVARMIFMTGASYRSTAEAALDTPAGRTLELVNITSRENDLFDFLFERLTRAPRPGDRAIGQGLDAPNALTVELDCPRTLRHLSDMGHPVAAPRRRICHWSAYTRPGALRFYAGLLRDGDRLTLPRLRAGLPDAPAPRWSRLLPIPSAPMGEVMEA